MSFNVTGLDRYQPNQGPSMSYNGEAPRYAYNEQRDGKLKAPLYDDNRDKRGFTSSKVPEAGYAFTPGGPVWQKKGGSRRKRLRKTRRKSRRFR
jgi:hypothetical protein